MQMRVVNRGFARQRLNLFQSEVKYKETSCLEEIVLSKENKELTLRYREWPGRLVCVNDQSRDNSFLFSLDSSNEHDR